MKKVICVVGPTASGKTKLSIILAKHFNAPIISCDSVAVYKRLDIGSAKPTDIEQKDAKHYLIDIMEPNEQFDVATCQKMAREIIDENELSILCGGTGLYVQGVINNYEFESPKRTENFALSYESFTNDELYKLLLEKDCKKALEIHPNNRKRVLRALEASINGSNLSNYVKHKEKYYDAYIVYLDIERETLYDRINKRVDSMIEMGLEEEVRSLANDNIFPRAIGYQEWLPFFRGEVSRESCIEEIKKNTRHLAKRQKTWFKNQTDAHFYQVNLDDFSKTANLIINDIEEFLTK